MILTDLADPTLGLLPPEAWYVATDRVMGGVSAAEVRVGEVSGRAALHFTARVSLENNGGFALVGARFDPALDATQWTGIAFEVTGTGFGYAVSVRTADTVAPWETYLAELPVQNGWCELRVPFSSLNPNRPLPPFNAGSIRRIAISARARAFDADLAVARVGLYV